MQISNSLANLYSATPKATAPIAPSTMASTPATEPAPLPTQSSSASTASTEDSPEKTFLDYMKKSTAEKLVDAWLASHHLTRKDLEAMPPEKRQAIEKQMAEEIKEQTKQAAENKANAKVNILA